MASPKLMRSMVFCSTCRFSAAERVGPDGRSGGETLIAHVREILQDMHRTELAVETRTCLWNCTRPCSVILRDDRRFTYVTGGHAPERAQAEAIVAWFDLHGETETGEVPFHDWPQRMRGHFIARIPPAHP